jgi:glycosyltransferase involved in cell wall biosynthesis
LEILFYGQCIPLHGISTILQAAQTADDLPIHWVLVGQGQEEQKIRELLQRNPSSNIKWIPWVPYELLIEYIWRSDICLGIFGSSGKAGRVIPNKVFQVIACAKPLITRDSPAIRELLGPDMPGVYLVNPGDAGALLAAVRQFMEERADLASAALHATTIGEIQPSTIGRRLVRILTGISADRTPVAPTVPGDRQ